MAIGHEYNLLVTENVGLSNDERVIHIPVNANRICGFREISSFNFSTHSRGIANRITEGNVAVFNSRRNVGRHVKGAGHIGVVFNPVIEDEHGIFESNYSISNREGRSYSGIAVGNDLAVHERILDEELHVELAGFATRDERNVSVNDNRRTFNNFFFVHPSRANRRFISRKFRNCDFGTGINSFALIGNKVEVAEVVGLDQIGVDFEIGLHVREFLIPAIKAVAFDNRFIRSFGASTVSNLLFVMGLALDEEDHVELANVATRDEINVVVNDNRRAFNNFIVVHPSGANRGIISRKFRNCNFGTGINSFALLGFKVEVAEVVGLHQLGVNFQVGRHVREFLIPTVKAEAFDNRIGRSLSVSMESNGLFVIGFALDIERHSEGLSNLFELSRVSRIFGSSSERSVPTSELVGCGIRFEVSRDFRAAFFVVVEHIFALLEGLLGQCITVVGNESDFEQFVQHGMVGHATRIELVLSFFRGQHIAIIVRPTLEGSTSDLRILHGGFDNMALDGRSFEIGGQIISHVERNLVVTLAAKEVKHRIIARFEEPNKCVFNLAVLSVQNTDKIFISVHFGSRLAFNSRNRGIVFRTNRLCDFRQNLRIVVAVFDLRIVLMRTFVSDLTDNTTHSLTRNRVRRAEGVQHHGSVVTGLIFRIIIKIAITDNATGNSSSIPASISSSNRAIVTAVVDGAIHVFAGNTTSDARARHRAEVLTSSNTARNKRNIFTRYVSIVRASHNTASSFARNCTIVNARANRTRIRTGNTASHFSSFDRGIVRATNHRAVATITTSNTTDTTGLFISMRHNRNIFTGYAIFHHTVVQSNNGSYILDNRSPFCPLSIPLGFRSHGRIINFKIFDITILANYTKEASI